MGTACYIKRAMITLDFQYGVIFDVDFYPGTKFLNRSVFQPT